ncbi:MAG TPA: response regulator [Thermodesulfobacteriota bacterium]|nr:response regulator [Thermodesulfobacteriota bacterium]
METLNTISRQNKDYRFLMVDDSMFARKNISKVVEAIGGVVAGEASNGKEAVDKYFELKPDLVLMDISMPEMEGIEALSIIRQRDIRARIVIVSALGYDDLVKRSIALGAKHFIVKPIDLEKVAAVIRFVLEQEGDSDEV